MRNALTAPSQHFHTSNPALLFLFPRILIKPSNILWNWFVCYVHSVIYCLLSLTTILARSGIFVLFTHISQVPKRVPGIQYAFSKYLLNKLTDSSYHVMVIDEIAWEQLIRWKLVKTPNLLYLDVEGRGRGISERGLRMNSQRGRCITWREWSHGVMGKHLKKVNCQISKIKLLWRKVY